jgi:hypothetical protein
MAVGTARHVVGIVCADSDRRHQWRTLPIIVGGAKSHYIEVEGANLKYFIFYMVKTYKY